MSYSLVSDPRHCSTTAVLLYYEAVGRTRSDPDFDYGTKNNAVL